jgi:hypothetical protein
MAKAAFHEAGHAVVAWSFGLVVHGVYLDVANNSGGMQILPEPLPDDVTHRIAIGMPDLRPRTCSMARPPS